MRLRKVLWLVVLCILFTLAWFIRKSGVDERSQWEPLKMGGKIRGVAATKRSSFQFRFPEPSLEEKLSSAWKTRSLQVFASGGGTWTVPNSGHEFCVWIEAQGAPANLLFSRIPQIRDCEIALPDGQILFGMPDGNGTSSRGVTLCNLARFPIAPWHERELTVSFTLDGIRHELKVPNYSYQTDLATWSPEPLPKTWQDGNLAVTLESLDLQWNEKRYYHGVRWSLNPRWSIKLDGKPADSWFHVGCTIQDSGGNVSVNGGLLGETAWKLRGQVSRSYGYPFAESEVNWIGRFDPGEIKKQGNARYLVPMLPGDLVARGIILAGIFTPGIYELQDGTVVRSAAPSPEKPIKQFKATFDPATRRLRLEVHKPVIVRHTNRRIGEGEDEFQVWQREDGKGLYLPLSSTSGMGSEILDWAPLPDRPFRYGMAKQQRFQFEMFVKPPKAPERKLR